MRNYVLDTRIGRYIITTGLGLLASTLIAAAQQDTITVSKKGRGDKLCSFEKSSLEDLEYMTGLRTGAIQLELADDGKTVIKIGDYNSKNRDYSDLYPEASASDEGGIKDDFASPDEISVRKELLNEEKLIR